MHNTAHLPDGSKSPILECVFRAIFSIGILPKLTLIFAYVCFPRQNYSKMLFIVCQFQGKKTKSKIEECLRQRYVLQLTVKSV